MNLAIANAGRSVTDLLSQVIGSADGLRLCWTAADGHEAVLRCRENRPDLLLMDLLLPGLDGIATTRQIMAQSPCPILVVTASIPGLLTQVYDAIAAGALDAAETPSLGSDGVLRGGDALLRKIALIHALTRPDSASATSLNAATAQVRVTRLPPIVAIGASTGGPGALAAVLGALPSDIPAAVIVVQHLDACFIAGLVSSLAERTALPVAAVGQPTRPMPGTIHVAARDAHLILNQDGLLDYVSAPSDGPHCPSIDVLFHSIAAHAPATGCGVLLTGMGRDGAAGLLALRHTGFLTLAQDRASSVVWGIPGAAVALDAACQVLPLTDIAAALCAWLQSPQRVSPARWTR